MPNISLRLSDEEHEQLRLWARGSRRSMQREIVFRLFDGAVTEREVSGVKHHSPGGGSGASPGSDRGDAIVDSRSVTVAVPPPVQDVSVRRRPHYKKHRPAVQCPQTELVGGVCPDCGWQEEGL